MKPAPTRYFLNLFILMLLLHGIHTKAQTVYITENGKKYHSKNCQLVKTGKKGLDRNEALKRGYEACTVCKPATTKAKKEEKPGLKNKK